MDGSRDEMKQQLDSPFIKSMTSSYLLQEEDYSKQTYVDLKETKWRFLILFFVCYVKFAT